MTSTNLGETTVGNIDSSEPSPIAWQAKLAAALLIGWTLFLAWIAFA